MILTLTTLKLKISSNELQLLPQLQKLLNGNVSHALVIDLHLDIALPLELLEVLKLRHAQLDQYVVLVERFEGLDVGSLIGSEWIWGIVQG